MGDGVTMAVDEHLWRFVTRVFDEAAEVTLRSPDAGPLPTSFLEAVDSLEVYWHRQTMSPAMKTVDARLCRLLTSAGAEAVALSHLSPTRELLLPSFLEAIRAVERYRRRMRDAA
jgi:hypothetical protein